MANEDYLKHCDVKILPTGSIDVEDIFGSILLYLESHETHILRNTLINCLTYPKTDEERLKNLKKFGVILKELGYIDPSFMEQVTR